MCESLLLSIFLKREGNKEGIYRCGACRNNHAGNRGGAGRGMRSGNHGLLRRLPQRFRFVTYYPSVSSGGGINASSTGNMKPLICLCVGLTALLIAAGAASSVAVQAISRLRSPVDSIVLDTAPAARVGHINFGSFLTAASSGELGLFALSKTTVDSVATQTTDG
ncbi:hypothetical protein KSP40_PGU010161 [Platanthera guangdongensis]|uniref:Uncharacterized protein n=1 Tax=Platanthera guangdongensis TaxID=2320717 RepID=A0ABR2MH30_9ASPA